MATIMRAGEVTLRDLGTKLGLQLTEDVTFFSEWHVDLTEISAQEQQQLDRIRAGYINLVYQATMVEDTMKMAVLAPLLYLADFFLPPFAIQSEVATQLSITDEDLNRGICFLSADPEAEHHELALNWCDTCGHGWLGHLCRDRARRDSCLCAVVGR